MPMHIKAEKGDIAEKVVAVEDKETAFVLSGLLKNPKLVNKNRELYVYTGNFKGHKVSIATHGIGAPSSSLVFEELSQLGVKLIIRLGTARSLNAGVKNGDVVVSRGASYVPGGTVGEYVTESFFVLAAVPDLLVSEKLVEKLSKSGVPVKTGPTFSNDNYYSKYYDNRAKNLNAKNFLCADMECASLLVLSSLRSFRAACVLMITEELPVNSGKAISEEDLKKLITKVGPAVFDALIES
mgnify:CR=1 FL=1